MTSPMLGALQPAIYRFSLGAFEITTISDGALVRGKLHPMFAENQPAESVHALARANHIDEDKFVHGFIPTLVNTGHELVLFDVGFGPARSSEGLGKLVERMATAGYKPEDVDVVVITHGHPDHIAGLMQDGKPMFPRARYVFGAAEFDHWKRGDNIREARKTTRDLFVKVAVPLAPQSTFIKPGDDVVSGIRAVDAFGHSAGHLAFHLESERRQVLIWADCALHYVMSLQRPEWTVDVDDDKDKAKKMRRRIYDMVATDKLWTVGYHMPFPGIGTVERFGDTYRWVPASYQMSM